MNIAVYSHYFSPEIGAPSARIYDLSQQWLKQNHDVTVVTCFPNHPTGEIYPGYELARHMQEDLDGIEVHRNWTYVTPNKGVLKRTLGHISFWPSARLFSDRHLGHLDITIGTSPTLFAPMAARSGARRRDIPFIMEVRDLWPALFTELGVISNRQIIGLLEKWEMWMYHQATKIVTVTEAFRQNIVERGIAPEKVHTIPNGADIHFWQPSPTPDSLRRELELQNKFVVLYMGAHGISQALSSVLDSAARLQEEEDIHFLFVGEGAEKELLLDKASSENLTNVTFHEPVPKDQVGKFYALADVCLVPLRDIPLFDAFIPSKMFEILAMERPIIASLRGEAADILRRSGGAVVVPPEDSKATAESILTLYNNPEQKTQMGKKGRQFIINHYSREKLAQDYIDVLSTAIREFDAT